MDDEQLRHYCEIDAEKHQYETNKLSSENTEESKDYQIKYHIVCHILNAAFLLKNFSLNKECLHHAGIECKNSLDIIFDNLYNSECSSGKKHK